MQKPFCETVRVFTRFQQRSSVDETNAFLSKLALTHAEKVTDQPVREYLTGCINGGDLRALCDFDVSYAQLTPADAGHVRQICAFFQKRDDLQLGIDRREVALRSFREAEHLCSETNDVFDAWSQGKFQFTPRVEAALHAAQRKITAILGDVPLPGDIKFRFGPGATTQRKRKWSHPLYKLADGITCSEDLLPVCDVFLAEMPQWCHAHSKVQSDSRYILDVTTSCGRVNFVPKSWKTLRAIVVEPSLNTMCQAGVGDFMASRLKLYGIDITDQSRNQQLAKSGSRDGRVATLDLSSASDTIAIGLVAHLLPPDWLELLSFIRTGEVNLEGELIQLEKFSTMGNGYTFPLETLIFHSLAIACCEGRDLELVSTYGDDMIVPSHAVEYLREVLHACGFVLNSAKSFWDGPFRESCGKDYSSGIDIRPYYQRDALSGQSLFSLHNFYYRKGDLARSRIVLSHIGQELRVFGPDGYGDGHLIHEDWHAFASRRPKNATYGGSLFRTYTAETRRSYTRTELVNAAYVTYSVYEQKPYLPQDASWHEGLARTPSIRRSVFHLRGWASEFTGATSPKGLYTKGRLGVVLPGAEKYRLISVYTFVR